MTMHADLVAVVAKRLSELMRPMVMAEVERIAAAQAAAPLAKVDKAEAEIFAACRAVAAAADRLAQAKFSGAEPAARMSLERAGKHLGAVMRKHGRYTGGV